MPNIVAALLTEPIAANARPFTAGGTCVAMSTVMAETWSEFATPAAANPIAAPRSDPDRPAPARPAPMTSPAATRVRRWCCGAIFGAGHTDVSSRPATNAVVTSPYSSGVADRVART
ncbi:hypothetical protein CRM89_05130 [Nocardia sp. FDAARGOS_372]|nr:hypothetical protein CRM89_05130 [Nocardia sp. FDAARGOS_372]